MTDLEINPGDEKQKAGTGWQWKIIDEQTKTIRQLKGQIERQAFAVDMAKKTVKQYREKLQRIR